jgi:hypothetical protein
LYFAQTAFKRLWWEGYDGGFGLYDWPTLYGFPNAFAPNATIHHYDDSEMIAWLSATALADVMESLNGSGQLRVWAHSMGNIVFGEAMRKYGGGSNLKAYIASQAAMPASLYSQSAPVTTWGPLGIAGPTTPNIHAYWHSGNTNSADDTYLVGNAANVDRMCNYYNALDYALDWWEFNNRYKPDGALGYGFAYGGSVDFYDEGVAKTNRFHRYGGSWFSIEGLEITASTNLNERYQVFSYCAESRTKALGQASNSVFTYVNRNLEGPPLGYDSEHYSHSRQFRSNILDEKAYYEYVIDDGDL